MSDDCEHPYFFEGDGPDLFDKDIGDAICKFEQTQDGLWLLEAIRRSIQYGKPIQERVRTLFENALEKYRSSEARTLDEAFGVSRPKSWSQTSAKMKARKARNGYMTTAGAIYQSVVIRRSQGRAVDEELFAEIGIEHNVSWSTARKYYQEVKKMIVEEKSKDASDY